MELFIHVGIRIDLCLQNVVFNNMRNYKNWILFKDDGQMRSFWMYPEQHF